MLVVRLAHTAVPVAPDQPTLASRPEWIPMAVDIDSGITRAGTATSIVGGVHSAERYAHETLIQAQCIGRRGFHGACVNCCSSLPDARRDGS
jgi:hypothetical protein